MPSPLFRLTLQAALFSVASTLLAQSITMCRAKIFTSIDLVSLIQFMLIAIMMTPPNYAFQKWLEEKWPARPVVKRGGKEVGMGKGDAEGKLSVRNTVKKFLLDQSLGAAANTAGFVILLSLLRGHGLDVAMKTVQKVRPLFLPTLLATTLIPSALGIPSLIKARSRRSTR